MASSRLLVSGYVSEDRDEDRRTARACNIAKWFIDNFSSNAGKRINIKDLRRNIPDKVKDSGLDPTGDLKAHGDAVNTLNLGRLTKKGKTMVDFSLPNLKRCTSWILGQGQKVGAVQLIRENDQRDEDNALIDLGMEIPADKLTEWERIFIHSLNKKWREKGLSDKQKARLKLVIRDRA